MYDLMTQASILERLSDNYVTLTKLNTLLGMVKSSEQARGCANQQYGIPVLEMTAVNDYVGVNFT